MPLHHGGRDEADGGAGTAAARVRLVSAAADAYRDLRLEPVLRRLLEHTGAATGSASGAVSVIDADGGRYTKAAEQGVACLLGRSFPLDEGATGRAVALRRPVVVRDYAELPGAHVSARTPAGHRSVLAVPAWWRGEVIAVNVVFRPPGVGFSTRTVDAVEALTQVVAPAIRLVRPLAERTLAAEALVVEDVPGWGLAAQVDLADPDPVVPDPFTEREREVLALLRHGLTDRAIAATLGRSAKTVEKHVGALIRKTGASNRTAAVLTALDRGWLPA